MPENKENAADEFVQTLNNACISLRDEKLTPNRFKIEIDETKAYIKAKEAEIKILKDILAIEQELSKLPDSTILSDTLIDQLKHYQAEVSQLLSP